MGTDRFTAENFAPGLTEQDVADAVRGVRDEVRRMIEAAKAELSMSLAKIVSDQIKARLDEALSLASRQADSERKAMKDALASFERTVKAMPRPEVNVNVPKQEAPAVNVTVPQGKAPEVTVNVPQARAPEVTVNVPKLEQPAITVNVPKLDQPTVNVAAPHVEVRPADVVVNVPKLDQPTVNVTTPEVTVNVPEQKPPEVTVEVPRRRITKTIEYDDQGRPSRVTEEEGD